MWSPKSDKLTLFKLVYQLIRGKIDEASDVYSFSADQVRIESKRKKLMVAIDGETVEMTPPLNISVLKNSLSVMVPHDSASLIYILVQKGLNVWSHPAILSGSSIGSGGSQRRSHPASTFGTIFACKRFLDQLNTPYLVIPGIMTFRFIIYGIGYLLHLPVINYFW